MYTLYIANKNYSSWSLRAWLLLSVLEIPFEERLLPLQQDSDGAAFHKHTPHGKVPCLLDGETVVWESLAIAEYLFERHPAVWPTDPLARAWARCAAAEMHGGFSALRQDCSMNCGVRVRLHSLSPALQSDIARIDQLWREGLERFGGPFLAGDAFTAVDAFFAPVAVRVRTYGLELSQHATTYAQHLLALPSLHHWEDAALLEDFREPGHEQEMLANGTLLEDSRVPAR